MLRYKHIVYLSQKIRSRIFVRDDENTIAYKNKVDVRGELILGLSCEASYKYHNVYCSLPFGRKVFLFLWRWYERGGKEKIVTNGNKEVDPIFAPYQKY